MLYPNGQNWGLRMQIDKIAISPSSLRTRFSHRRFLLGSGSPIENKNENVGLLKLRRVGRAKGGGKTVLVYVNGEELKQGTRDTTPACLDCILLWIPVAVVRGAKVYDDPSNLFRSLIGKSASQTSPFLAHWLYTY